MAANAQGGKVLTGEPDILADNGDPVFGAGGHSSKGDAATTEPLPAQPPVCDGNEGGIEYQELLCGPSDEGVGFNTSLVIGGSGPPISEEYCDVGEDESPNCAALERAATV